MNIGLLAHNSKKSLMEDFCLAYKKILEKHELKKLRLLLMM